MFVKNISVSQKTDKLPVEQFNFERLTLKNYREETVFETNKLSSDNPEVTLDSQAYCGYVEIVGSAVVPEDESYGLLETIVGQSKAATWSLNTTIAPGEQDLDCVFALPPTTLNLLGGRLPIPVKSVCEAGISVPDELS